MMIKRILYTLFLAIFFVAPIRGQVKFEIEAPSVVSQGERFTIQFTANARIDNFTPPTISGATVLVGPYPTQSSHTQIINGKRSNSFQHTYTYVLQAGDNQLVAVSGASASIDGSQYSSRPVTIEVVSGSSATGNRGNGSNGSNGSNSYAGGGNNSNNNNNSNNSSYGTPDYQSQQNQYDADYERDNITYGKADIFLRLHLNKTRVVKGEPIIATLKIYTRSGIAGFEDIKFPVFNGFWSQELESPQNINFSREKVGNQIYNSALLRRYVLIPQQIGTLSIEPAEMVCQVQVMERGASGRSIFDDFFGVDTYSIQKKRLVTGRQNVVVQPLPQGAPDSFGGGVGNFNMNVRLSKDSLKSNDAASVIVEISGSGNLNLIETPVVRFPDGFETYDVITTNNFSYSSEGNQGKKVFEYPFIPRVEEEYLIEPIQYSYYNLAQRKYVTLVSDSLAISIAKGDGSASSNYTDFASQRQVSNLGEDIRYIKPSANLRSKGNWFIGSWWYYILLLSLLILSAIVYWLLKRRNALKADVVRVKNKKASKKARGKLRQSYQYLKENKSQDFYSSLHTALEGYIEDKLSIPHSDMQKENISKALSERNLDKEQIDRFIELLDECEMIRYSPNPQSFDMKAHYDRATNVIQYFEGKL